MLYEANDPVRIVGMRVGVCVCPTPEAINNQWCDVDLTQLVNEFYSCYMATVVVIINGHGLDIGTRHRH